MIPSPKNTLISTKSHWELALAPAMYAISVVVQNQAQTI
jgi:hypothetical protein